MSEALRRLVRKRADGRCEYCRLPDSIPPIEPFHLEHIIARQHRGATEEDNLAWACHRCNRHKGPNLSGIDPETGDVVQLYNPRRAAWTWHFTLDGFELAGTTPPGRATVTLLQMNAPRRVERRADLVRRGLF